MKQPKVYFFHDDDTVYVSEEPAFHNLSANTTVKNIIQHYSEIRAEAEALISGEYQIQAANPNAPDSNSENAWTHLYFLNYMLPYSTTKKHFPKIAAILLSDPNITLCGIARLKAGGRLLPHCGETNAIIRCHLGLKVPGNLPEIGIRVKDEKRAWHEGEVLAFNDAYNHEAWNNTNEDRYLLIFDIIKPALFNKRKFICACCLGIAATRVFLGKLGLYRFSPIWFRKIVAFPLAIIGYFIISFSRR